MTVKSLLVGFGLGLLASVLVPLRDELLTPPTPEVRADASRQSTVVPAVSGVEAQANVLELPDDAHEWHTILILSPDWRSRAEERRVQEFFHSEPRLNQLRLQTHWHQWTTDDEEWLPFRDLVRTVPALIVERANGQVIYRESGPDLGRQPHLLAQAIRKEVQRHCPDGRCLPLHPTPNERKQEPPRDEIPAVLREEPAPPAKPPPNPLATVLLGVASIAAGAAARWKKQG